MAVEFPNDLANAAKKRMQVPKEETPAVAGPAPAIGSLLGAIIGSIVAPGSGTKMGASIGGLAGEAAKGLMESDDDDEEEEDEDDNEEEDDNGGAY